MTGDVITVPPTHSNPVPFYLKAALTTNGREGQKRATIYNRFVTWKKLWRAHSLLMYSSSCSTDCTFSFLVYLHSSPLALFHISHLFPCHLLCISSGAVSQALNSICTLLLMPPVPHRAGKTIAGCTAPQCIQQSVWMCDLNSTAPKLISCLHLSFHHSTPCGVNRPSSITYSKFKCIRRRMPWRVYPRTYIHIPQVTVYIQWEQCSVNQRATFKAIWHVISHILSFPRDI